MRTFRIYRPNPMWRNRTIELTIIDEELDVKLLEELVEKGYRIRELDDIKCVLEMDIGVAWTKENEHILWLLSKNFKPVTL